MILVDTSVWVGHLRKGNGQLQQLLSDGDVACHPFVLPELACGNLRNRSALLLLLRDLPQAPTVSDQEWMVFLEQHRLMGQGLGFVDVHLLASARLGGMTLWTADRRLNAAARRLGMAHG